MSYCSHDCRFCYFSGGQWWDDSHAPAGNYCPSCGRRLNPDGTSEGTVTEAVAVRALGNCTFVLYGAGVPVSEKSAKRLLAEASQSTNRPEVTGE